MAFQVDVDIIVVPHADRLGEPRKPQNADDPEGHDSWRPHPCDSGADSGLREAGRNDPGNRRLPRTIGPDDRVDLLLLRGAWGEARRGRLDRRSDRLAVRAVGYSTPARVRRNLHGFGHKVLIVLRAI